MFGIALSSNSDINRSNIRKLLDFIFNMGWEQNHYAGDLIEYTGLLFCKVAYSRYDVPIKIF